jgi:hypothetical protein
MEIINNNNDLTLEKNDEFSLKQFIVNLKYWYTFLISKKKYLIYSILISLIIALVVSYLETPEYTAITTFAMEEDKGSSSGLGGALGIASSFGIDLGAAGGGGVFAASNISSLMKSHLIIEKVLLKPVKIEGKTTTLANYYIEINNYKKKWKNKLELNNLNFPPTIEKLNHTRIQDSILNFFYKKLTKDQNLTIQQKDKKITIINIEVTSIDELFSKLFCEGLAKETSEFYIQTKSKKARINTNVLQKQADSVKNELNLAITGVAQDVDKIYNLNPSLNIKGASTKKKQIDISANTEVLKQILIQLELSKITLRKETPLIQLIDQPTFPLEQIKFGYLKTIILFVLMGIVLSSSFLIFRKMLQNLMV